MWCFFVFQWYDQLDTKTWVAFGVVAGLLVSFVLIFIIDIIRGNVCPSEQEVFEERLNACIEGEKCDLTLLKELRGQGPTAARVTLSSPIHKQRPNQAGLEHNQHMPMTKHQHTKEDKLLLQEEEDPRGPNRMTLGDKRRSDSGHTRPQPGNHLSNSHVYSDMDW